MNRYCHEQLICLIVPWIFRQSITALAIVHHNTPKMRSTIFWTPKPDRSIHNWYKVHSTLECHGLCPLHPLPFRPSPFRPLAFGPLPIRPLTTWSSCQIVLYHLVLSYLVHLPFDPHVNSSCVFWSFIISSSNHLQLHLILCRLSTWCFGHEQDFLGSLV